MRKPIHSPRPKERYVIFNNYKEIGVIRITPRKWLVVSCFVKNGLKSIRVHLRISIGNDPNMPDFIDKYNKGIEVTLNGPEDFAEEDAMAKLLKLLVDAKDFADIMPLEDNVIYATEYDRPLSKDWYKD